MMHSAEFRPANLQGAPMEPMDRIASQLDRLGAHSPTGYAIALHVDFTTPRYLFQSYARDWATHYARGGLVMKDPAVRWGLENDGVAEHADLVAMDEHGVFEQACAFGLEHWLVVATSAHGSKSIGAFSRAGDGFDAQAREEVVSGFGALHELTLGVEDGSELQSFLGKISVGLTHPHE